MKRLMQHDSILMEFRVRVRVSIADPENAHPLDSFATDFETLYAIREGLQHMQNVGFPHNGPEGDALSIEVVDVL